MAHSVRAERVGDQMRIEISELLAREVKDPRVGFVTITEVRVTNDLQVARVYWTTLAQGAARDQAGGALDRVAPFLRRHLGQRLRLRRVPELHFVFDESVERYERIERLLQEIKQADAGPPDPEEEHGPDRG